MAPNEKEAGARNLRIVASKNMPLATEERNQGQLNKIAMVMSAMWGTQP
jgi:hypothetical protein